MGVTKMRKMASIQKIIEVKPIAGADAIEAAVVNGWEVVVKKDEFKAGDLAIYFEIDSFMSVDEPAWNFLRNKKKMNDQEGFVLKTIKLRGQMSQGLLLPIETLAHKFSPEKVVEGADISEELGVVVYEKPIPACLRGKMRGNFPSFLKKTDEERIQNIRFDEIKDLRFFITEKMDGSSCTIYIDPNTGEDRVCSRNVDLIRDENNSFWEVAIRENLHEKLRAFNELMDANYALQGELIGYGIQGNPYHLPYGGKKFVLFTVQELGTRELLNFSVVASLGKMHDIAVVKSFNASGFPIEGIASFPLIQSAKSVHDLLAFADRNPHIYEGFVFKGDGHETSFKVISNNYLLKHDS